MRRSRSNHGPSTPQAARTDAHDLLHGLFDRARSRRIDPTVLSIAYALYSIAEDISAIRRAIRVEEYK